MEAEGTRVLLVDCISRIRASCSSSLKSTSMETTSSDPQRSSTSMASPSVVAVPSDLLRYIATVRELNQKPKLANQH